MRDLGRFREAAEKFLREKYGDCHIEFSEVYVFGGLVEVSGVLRLRGERAARRFTVKLDSQSLLVKGFGLR
ncbi:hypothetical protein HRbin01_00462 [archaeon HR01]|nr:hypothetical protein HRbin01_00462 [archaeon HR01]